VQLSSLLAPICTALSVGFIWPQVIRVYRLHSVEGIAPKGTLHGLAGVSLWTVYGFAKGIVPLSISNVTVVTAMLLIALAQVAHKVLPARHLAVVVVGFTALGLVSSLGVSPALCGWLATAVSATSVIPQSVHVLRTKDLSGVSLTMYGLLILTGTAWGLYGILIGDIVVSAPNLIIVPSAILVALRVWRFQAAARSDEDRPLGEFATAS
jgi:MtN3 and saliva related transmembrane protein